MGLLDLLLEWASDVWNWLKNFCKKWWGRITGWWSKLKEWVTVCLKKYKEIVLLDSRHSGGRELIEAIHQAQPDTVTINDIDNGPVAVSINHDGTVGKLDSHNADVIGQDQYDSQQASHNGILRITG